MKVAIIDGNILAAIGLKQILSTVMPMMHIDTFGTMAELHANAPDTYSSLNSTPTPTAATCRKACSRQSPTAPHF